ATPRTIESSSTESEGPTPKTEEEPIEPVIQLAVSGGELVTFSPNSLSALVVSGHHDPFETYPCELPKEFVSPVLDQGERRLLQAARKTGRWHAPSEQLLVIYVSAREGTDHEPT